MKIKRSVFFKVILKFNSIIYKYLQLFKFLSFLMLVNYKIKYNNINE